MLIAQLPVDYEKKQSYDVTIKSKDNGVPSQYFIKTFNFNVIDVNEAPSAIELSSYDVCYQLLYTLFFIINDQPYVSR